MGVSELFTDWRGDVRLTVRRMARSPGFVMSAVLLLSLGTAVTGTVFSAANGWLAVRKAIPHSDRLVYVSRIEHGESSHAAFKEAQFRHVLNLRLRSISHLFAVWSQRALFSTGGQSKYVRVDVVTGAFADAVGVPPLVGRALRPDDDRAGEPAAVMVGEHAWRRLFGGDPKVVGRQIDLSGLRCTVVGVLPAALRGLALPTYSVADFWVPWEAMRRSHSRPGETAWGSVFGRLVQPFSVAQADAEMRVAAVRLDPAIPELGAAVVPIERGVTTTRIQLAIGSASAGLVALASLVLLIACANIASLFLARSVSRTAELSLRVALGAGRLAVLRVQILETATIVGLGATVGYMVVQWLGRTAGSFSIQVDPRTRLAGTLLVDGTVVAFFFVLVAATAATVGLLPALWTLRLRPAHALAASVSSARTTDTFERRHTRLVVAQVAASTVLLVVAGLFVRSVLRASQHAVDFAARTVAVGHVDATVFGWDESRGRAHQDALLRVARTVPGTTGAALASALPANGGGELVSIEADDARLGRREFGPPCRCVSVSPGFFETIGLRRLRGHDFTDADTAASGGVVIVNEVAAARLWEGRDPMGQRLRIRKGPLLDVVGLVATSDRTAREFGDRCYVFVPMAQRYKASVSIAVRGVGEPPAGALAAAVARELPEAGLFDVAAATTHLTHAADPLRPATRALVVLGLVGLVIAGVGLFAVMRYVVGLRWTEFGVRKALGATDAHIYRLVAWKACRTVGEGVAVGLPLAFLASLCVRRALVGVATYDVVTYLIVAVCLLSVGLVAAFGPALQAARVHPGNALRTL